MSAATVELIPALGDNYIYLVTDAASGRRAVIDPGEAGPIQARLDGLGAGLDLIVNTHHHGDHTGGNAALKAAHGCPVAGPAAEAGRIAELDRPLEEGDRLALGELSFEILATPGHTAGHISLVAREAGLLFAGDTLFSMGCGRLFEGEPATMWASLRKLRALPDGIGLYCGHEYSLTNARFALSLGEANAALEAAAERVARQRESNRPTLPADLGEEKRINPFLRADDADLKAALGMAGAADEAVFAEIRRRRDSW